MASSSNSNMTAASCRSRSASRIRSRFLRSVGIVAEAASASASAPRSRVRPRPESAAAAESSAKQQQQQPLDRSFSSGGSEDSEDTASTCSMSSSSLRATPPPTPTRRSSISSKGQQQPSGKRPSKSVTFSPTSTMRPIPSRSSYSPRIRSALWSTSDEMREAIERNTIEYLSEGWTWTCVLEEEDMFLDAATGERIHPVHVERMADLARERYRQVEALHLNGILMSGVHDHRDNFLQKSRMAARAWSQVA